MLCYSRNRKYSFYFDASYVETTGLMAKLNENFRKYTLSYKYTIIIQKSKLKKKTLELVVQPKGLQKSILSHYKLYLRDNSLKLYGELNVENDMKEVLNVELHSPIISSKHSIYNVVIRLKFNGERIFNG